ncbi:uncharacterized protein LOC119281688 isoform X1 [Triticum dicoccoides]|uniref:uncharacterized protein LOC119281688 isoform X1 n=1 Tax=Triticum dicoccoides TaxID=85692 RepID=UPI00189072C9|nr:uncharacterized protein LOC119281688 isoform X1 [Triticum dicoccoides]
MAMSILGALKLAPSPPATAAQPAWLGSSSVRFHLANAGAAALVAASLLVADPALAFRGGGPYGQQVTRGQDLTGKDFSGQTLIKQDFKTSILRQTNFKGANLLGASFFDADLTGSLLMQTCSAQVLSSLLALKPGHLHPGRRQPGPAAAAARPVRGQADGQGPHPLRRHVAGRDRRREEEDRVVGALREPQ